MHRSLPSIHHTPLTWGIVALALVIRLPWGLSRPASDGALAQLPDQMEYLTLARNLLHGEGMSFIDPRFSQRVFAFRMPGYPLFIAACGANVRVVRTVQALLDTGTVIAVILLSRRLVPEDKRAAPLVSAALVAFNPLLVYFSGLVLSETLFVSMLVWGMVLLLAGFGSRQRAGQPIIWLAGGIILALAVLVRPSAGVLPVVLGVAALLVNRQGVGAYHWTPSPNPAGRWPLPVGTTMLLLVILVLTPWMLRNYRVFHAVLWTDTNAGITLYDGYNPTATGASDQGFVKRMPYLGLMNEMDRSDYLGRRAMEFVRRYPRRAVELALLKAARTWSPAPLSDQFGGGWHRAVLLCYSLPFYCLVVWGLWQGSLPRAAKVFLLVPAIYLTAVHALTIGSLRYRLPAEPPLAVLAASVFYRGSEPWRRA